MEVVEMVVKVVEMEWKKRRYIPNLFSDVGYFKIR